MWPPAVSGAAWGIRSGSPTRSTGAAGRSSSTATSPTPTPCAGPRWSTSSRERVRHLSHGGHRRFLAARSRAGRQEETGSVEIMIGTATPGARSLQRAVDDLVAGWRQRELWGHPGWQDIRQRYRRSILGPIWITISMAVTAVALGVLYAGLFGNDLSVQLPYVL